MLAASTTAAICQLSALSPAGRCRTFDAAADGYGRGEGVAVAVLGPIGSHSSCAKAIIRGSAVNQDGRSSGLTAPHGPSQSALIRRALQQASAGPVDAALVSLHGTGTPLGDPIEVGALGQALATKGTVDGSQRLTPLSLASSKSCYGHTEGAAGLSGILMAAACLGASAVAPVMHLRGLNPHVAAALGQWQWQRQQRSASAAAVPLQPAGEHLGAIVHLYAITDL